MLHRDKITLPNALSFYRLVAFPFALYCIIQGAERIFATLLIINLITDILDGWIARRYQMETQFGARLDSIADTGTYVLALTGVLVFKAADFAPHLSSLYIFIGLYVFANLLSLFKFGRMPSMHLYSWKIGGYMQGFFFFLLFTVGFITPYYYLMITWGILAFLEHIIIQFLIPEMGVNLKGLYWVLKNR